MGRVSRDAVLMELAEVISQRSTCPRLHVGVAFSKDGRLVMTGYNGAPAGMPHCNHDCTCDGPVHVGRPHHPLCPAGRPCVVAQHAERNAIAFAARKGVALEGTEAHITHMPCYDCAGSLINAGVVRVSYQHPYRDFAGVELLAEAGIEVVDYRLQGR